MTQEDLVPADPGTSPNVDVVVDTKQKRMVFSDNGSGMTLEGLQNFFANEGRRSARLRCGLLREQDLLRLATWTRAVDDVAAKDGQRAHAPRRSVAA